MVEHQLCLFLTKHRRSPSSTSITGDQSKTSLVFDISNRNEPNRLLASFFLPIIVALRFKSGNGKGKSIMFLLIAFAILFSSSGVDRSCASLARKI